MGEAVQPWDRAGFLATWALQLGCPNDPFEIGAHLINKAKNFQTAVHVVFGLSYRTHKEYALRCATYWKSIWPADGVCTAKWCIDFQQHYVADIEKYPDDA